MSVFPEFRDITRRNAVKLGLGGFVGAGFLDALLPPARAGEQIEQSGPAPIRSCILVFYYGGPSQLDTWDMKPEAPSEVRGEFQPIDTSAPGVRICEHLPCSARIMHHVAVVRSLHHPMRNHNSAAAEALTGRTPPGGDLELLNDNTLSYPCYGSALTYLRDRGQGVLSHVALPYTMYNVVTLPGQSAGFLGPAFERFQIEGDPNTPAFNVSTLGLPPGLSRDRFNERESLMRVIDRHGYSGTSQAPGDRMLTHYEKAFGLLRSEGIQRAVEINRENDATRERYGRNLHGQSLLLARRLVEAGVRFVTVFNGERNGQDVNWDSHQSVFPRHRDHLMPPADRGFAALVEDLDARGLLESTLVIALGEFGRTPRINASAGRDHWPDCFTTLLAGGGIRGGTVYGASDRIAAYPETNPVGMGDLAATLYWRFGIDSKTELIDGSGRPHRLAEGEPLRVLFA